MDDTSVITYLNDTADFYVSQKLQAFVDGIVAQGYYVAGADHGEVGAAWTAGLAGKQPEAALAVSADAVFTPGTSPALSDELGNFTAQSAQSLTLYLFSAAREGSASGFEATIELEPAEHTIRMSYQAQRELQPFLNWLDLLQHTYKTWQPLYSFKEDTEVDTSFDDAKSYNITRLYEINFWSKGIVEKLGAEKVQQIRVWKNIAFPDGGVMVVPILIGMGGKDEDYDYDPAAVAAELGLATAF